MNFLSNKKITRNDVLKMNVPQHIAFIMDGNGRWATKRLLPRKAGHKEGVKVLEKIVDEVFSLKIKHMSVFALSTENWSRPQEEIDALFDLIREYFTKTIDKFIKMGIKITFMGDISKFPEDLKIIINNAIQKSCNLLEGNLNIGLNYGGRSEIVSAAKSLAASGEEFNETNFEKHLYTNGMPNPDALIRTSGEYRLSNFMLYQAAYSEFFFTDTLWPDFSVIELYNIIEEFNKRNRRFGKIK